MSHMYLRLPLPGQQQRSNGGSASQGPELTVATVVACLAFQAPSVQAVDLKKSSICENIRTQGSVMYHVESRLSAVFLL